MNEITVQKAAARFGHGIPEIEQLGNGLINRTYKVSFTAGGQPVVLQCLNQRVFSRPENIILNYRLIWNHLAQEAGAQQIPALVKSHHGKDYWIDEHDNVWKATLFVSGSYTRQVATTRQEADSAAACFAGFMRALSALDGHLLYTPLPDFHDLDLRYQQFEEAIRNGLMMRLLRATHVISELRQRRYLVEYFHGLKNNPDYPIRLMHHDGKISNILFDEHTQKAICPVDLDTVMPGYFFSDLGDLIRTVACTEDENSTAWEKIGIEPGYYRSVLEGYLSVAASLFTPAEKTGIHYSGLLMVYMQSLRFVTDFLNNDIYYQTAYPEQNLNRALNQLILLEKLEAFLEEEYGLRVG